MKPGPGASGHLWTVGARLWRALRPPAAPPAAAWSTTVDDGRWGRVALSGWLSEPPGATELAILVHGLGGCAESPYAVRAAATAYRRGVASLRLNLRGADGSGEDLYHAGLTADLHAAVGGPRASSYPRLLVVGFSLGGHLALRFATETEDPRVGAVAAVCPPLDLDRGASVIDRPGMWVYRSYLLRHLKATYRQLARRGREPAPWPEVRRVRRLRDWDECTVAPRHGFAGAADYYARMSVAPLLGRLRLPALLVANRRDPMVPAATLEDLLTPVPDRLEVRWTARGGHVVFAGDLHLGVDAPPGLEEQVLAWARSRRGEAGGRGHAGGSGC